MTPVLDLAAIPEDDRQLTRVVLAIVRTSLRSRRWQPTVIIYPGGRVLDGAYLALAAGGWEFIPGRQAN